MRERSAVFVKEHGARALGHAVSPLLQTKLRTVGARFSLKTACKKLSALLRSMFLELSSQSASNTVSAACCSAVMSRHDKSRADHLAAPSSSIAVAMLPGPAECRHHSSCHDQRRRHFARQGPICNVTITMSASSIAQRQTCCQATASWFVDEYGT